jgi:hypothetical protein
MDKVSFLHSGNIGDVWACLPALRKYYENTGIKATLYLVNGQNGSYYAGAVHPTKNENGENVMLNMKVIEMMKPLLLAQSYIDEVRIYDEEPMDGILDLASFRDADIGMPAFSINRWYFYIFPDLATDLSGIWLDVPQTDNDFARDKIIITRTERYLNEKIDYAFLKPYEDEIVFCGTMREYNIFCMNYDLNIKKLHINNFLELAQAINQCRFHITNQTQAFQLSEGLKVPRILELSKMAPNCIPIGENAYDFFFQGALEWYFHLLN